MATKPRATQQLISTLVVIASIVAGYVTTRIWRDSQPSHGLPAITLLQDTSSVASPVNPFGSANGIHLIAFVIVASDCGWSTLPQGMDAIRAVRSRMMSEYGDSYAQISVVAVALGENIDGELRFLSELRSGASDRVFDQISVGGSWLNEEAVRFYWRERAAPALTPQVIVIERPVDTTSYVTDSTIMVKGDTVSAVVSGLRDILDWLDNDVPLSTASPDAI